MINHESKRPVTLEDLLRLKRAERPSAEFWTQFDRELRAKQLTALVEKRPWWAALPRAFAGLSRYYVPLGATAVLALTIVSVREFLPTSPTPAQHRDARGETAPATVAVSTTAVATVTSRADSGAVVPVATTDDRGMAVRAETLALNSETAALPDPEQFAQPEERATESAPVAREVVPNVHSRSATNNLVAFNTLQPAFARDLLGATRGFETRALSASKPKVDPLMQMTSPTASHRSSLLNASFTGNSVVPSARNARE